MRATVLSRPLYTGASRTATPAFVAQDDGNNPRIGGHFVINVSAAAAPSVVATIDGFDPLSATWYNLLTSVAIVATGLTVMKIYPGLAAAANVSVSDMLPPIWRLVMTHGNANAVTYTVAALLR